MADTNTKINISVKYEDLTARVRKHISIIGKRARTVNGEAMFTDLTPSSNEVDVLNDLFDSGAETLAANLVDLSVSYTDGVTESGETKKGKTFSFENIRWVYKESETSTKQITTALTEAVKNYLYNFCLAQFLSEIHPTTGAKYPPLYGQTYVEHCSVILANIRSIAYHKRPSSTPDKSISDISSSVV